MDLFTLLGRVAINTGEVSAQLGQVVGNAQRAGAGIGAGLTGGANQAATGLRGMASSAIGSITSLINPAALGVAAIGGLAAAATDAWKSYDKFEEGLNNVSTLLDSSAEETMAKYGNTILQLSVNVGKSAEDLTGGLYQIVSAVGEGADSMTMLEDNAKAASAGMATTKQAIDLSTAVMKGYGDVSAVANKKTLDLAFTTVKLGQTTFPELASSMGKVVPLAAALGVKQEELFGTMATLAGVTGNTAEVSTQLRATYQAFLKPTADMSKALGVISEDLDKQGKLAKGPLTDSWRAANKAFDDSMTKLASMRLELTKVDDTTKSGRESAKKLKDEIKDQIKAVNASEKAYNEASAAMGSTIVKGEGIQKALALVSEQAGGSSAKLGKMYGSVEAVGAVLAMTGSQAKTMGEKIAGMSKSSGEANKANEKTIDAGKQMAAAFEAVKIKVGQALNPLFEFGQVLGRDVLKGILDFMTGTKKGGNAAADFGAQVTSVFKDITAAVKFAWPLIVFIFEGVTAKIRGIIRVIQGTIGLVKAIFAGDWRGAWESFKTILSGALLIGLSSLGGWISSFGGKLISGAAGWLGRFAPQGAQLVGGFLARMASSAASGVAGVMNGIVSLLLSPLKLLPGSFSSIGGNIIRGLVQGITGGMGVVTGAIVGIAEGAVKAAKNALGMKSPSTVFRDQVGKHIITGIAEGMKDLTPLEREAVRLRKALIEATRIGDISGVVRIKEEIREFSKQSELAKTTMQAVTSVLRLHSRAHTEAGAAVRGHHAEQTKHEAGTRASSAAHSAQNKLLAEKKRHLEEVARAEKAAKEEQARLTEEVVRARFELAKSVSEAQISDGVQKTISSVERSSGAFTSFQDGLNKLWAAGVTLTVPLLDALKARFDALAKAQAAAADEEKRVLDEAVTRYNQYQGSLREAEAKGAGEAARIAAQTAASEEFVLQTRLDQLNQYSNSRRAQQDKDAAYAKFLANEEKAALEKLAIQHAQYSASRLEAVRLAEQHELEIRQQYSASRLAQREAENKVELERLEKLARDYQNYADLRRQGAELAAATERARLDKETRDRQNYDDLRREGEAKTTADGKAEQDRQERDRKNYSDLRLAGLEADAKAEQARLEKSAQMYRDYAALRIQGEKDVLEAERIAAVQRAAIRDAQYALPGRGPSATARNDDRHGGADDAAAQNERATAWAKLNAELERNAQIALDDVAAFDALSGAQNALDQVMSASEPKYAQARAGLEKLKTTYPELADQIDEMISKYAELDASLERDAAINKARSSAALLREEFDLGAISNDERRAGIEALVESLEAQANAESTTADETERLRIEIQKLQNDLDVDAFKAEAEAAKDLATLLDGLGKIAISAVNRILDSFDYQGSGVGEAVKSFATGIEGGLSSLAKGDWVGAIVSVVAGAVNAVIDLFQGAAKSAQKAMDDIKNLEKSLSFTDTAPFVRLEKRSRGWFADLFGGPDTIAVINEFAVNIAKSIEGGLKGGFSSGLKAWFDGTGTLIDGLKSGLRDGIIAAITEAVIQGAIIKTALGSLLAELSLAIADGLASGDMSSATGIISRIGAALPGLVSTLTTLLAPLKGALDNAGLGAPRSDTPSSTDTTPKPIDLSVQNVPSIQAVFGVNVDAVPRLEGAVSKFDAAVARAETMYNNVELMYTRVLNTGFKFKLTINDSVAGDLRGTF